MGAKRGSYAGWRDGEAENLRTLWEAGYTSALIAERLGKTRASVLGKVKRMGLKR